MITSLPVTREIAGSSVCPPLPPTGRYAKGGDRGGQAAVPSTWERESTDQMDRATEGISSKIAGMADRLAPPEGIEAKSGDLRLRGEASPSPWEMRPESLCDLCDRCGNDLQDDSNGGRMKAMLHVMALLMAPAVLPAQGSTPLTVVVDGTNRPISGEALGRLPRDSIRMSFHGQDAMWFRGLALASALREAGVRTDSLRGPALATRVVIEASDGYRVVLALADLDPSIGARHVILADHVDGKPLAPDEGPWRLIVAGDQRPSRSARQVKTIKVLTEPR
jgi:hypothetical protein